MLLGRKSDFAVECYHEPNYPNEHGWVFGRMCVWVQGSPLGDLDEPACMLNVTEGHVQDCLDRLDELWDEAVDGLSDSDAFQFLDSALYADDDRPNQQVYEEAVRFSKFDFLTNWGESFNGTKAFLLRSGADFRILYRLPSGSLAGGIVTGDVLVATMRGLLDWLAVEKKSVPTT